MLAGPPPGVKDAVPTRPIRAVGEHGGAPTWRKTWWRGCYRGAAILPNLFIVGVQKGGTTSLHNYLSRIPDVFMSGHKEPGFFLKHGDNRTYKTVTGTLRQSERPFATLEEYEALFAAGADCSWRGESSTGYFASDHAREHIGRMVPDARILICLREPIARAYSAYNWARKKGLEDCETFEEALAKEEARRKEGYWTTYRYAEKSQYAEPLLKWRASFRHVKVVLFEDLRDNPLAVVSDIARWLGVPAPDSVESEIYNPSGMDASALSRLARRVADPPRRRSGPVFRAFRHLVGQSTMRRLKRWMVLKLDRRMMPPPPIAPATRQSLQQYFRADIDRVEAAIGRTLVGWNGGDGGARLHCGGIDGVGDLSESRAQPAAAAMPAPRLTGW